MNARGRDALRTRKPEILRIRCKTPVRRSAGPGRTPRSGSVAGVTGIGAMLPVVVELRGGCFSRSCQESGRCQNVKANRISMRQEMVVIGNEWNFGCCAERREFSIVRIFDEGKVVGIDTAAKLSLWTKEISELIPTEGWNSAQNKLGLAPGRFVPNQLKTPFPDSREDARRCAFRVEARGYEDIRVDDNPFHSDFIHHKLAKISPKILMPSAEFAGEH
jgi:hypothetical protein